VRRRLIAGPSGERRIVEVSPGSETNTTVSKLPLTTRDRDRYPARAVMFSTQWTDALGVQMGKG